MNEEQFRVTCPHCDKVLKVPSKLDGRKGKCPRCEAELILIKPSVVIEEGKKVIKEGRKAATKASNKLVALVGAYPKQTALILIGMFLFTSGWVGGCTYANRGPTVSSGVPDIFGAQDGKAGKMTIHELRKEVAAIHGAGKRVPKAEFFKKYGKPRSVSTIGDNTFLLYKCKDGMARLDVNTAYYQGLMGGDPTVYVIDVDEQW